MDYVLEMLSYMSCRCKKPQILFDILDIIVSVRQDKMQSRELLFCKINRKPEEQ